MEIIPERKFEGWGKEGIPKIETLTFDKGEKSGLDLHTLNFINEVKSRDASSLNAPIKVGYDATLVSYLVNVVFKTGDRIYWDETTGLFKSEKANELVKVDYQNGWKLPSL